MSIMSCMRQPGLLCLCFTKWFLPLQAHAQTAATAHASHPPTAVDAKSHAHHTSSHAHHTSSHAAGKPGHSHPATAVTAESNATAYAASNATAYAPSSSPGIAWAPTAAQEAAQDAAQSMQNMYSNKIYPNAATHQGTEYKPVFSHQAGIDY